MESDKDKLVGNYESTPRSITEGGAYFDNSPINNNGGINNFGNNSGIQNFYQQNIEKVVYFTEIVLEDQQLTHWKAKFNTWEVFEKNHYLIKKLPTQLQTPFIGRIKELGELKQYLESTQTRIIVLAGPPTIGKSRLILEATSFRKDRAFFAVDASEITSNHIQLMDSWVGDHNLSNSVIVLTNPEFTTINSLMPLIMTKETLKLVIIITSTDKFVSPNYGFDSRVQIIQLNPLSNIESEEILSSVQANFSFTTKEWVVSQAGGNPGLLITAASVGDSLHQTSSDFTTTVAENLLKTFNLKSSLESKEVVILKLLSILNYCGVKDSGKQDLKSIIKVFGPITGISLPDVENALPKFVEIGIIRRLGFYVEVIPPLLGNYLADSIIDGNKNEVITLFKILSNTAKLHLANRLHQLEISRGKFFWESLFEINGELSDWEILSDKNDRLKANLLQLAVQIVPERVLQFIEDVLGKLHASKIEIEKDVSIRIAYQLSNVLKDLLLDERTGLGAIKCLSSLAQLEDIEKLSQGYAPASNIFLQAFNPNQPFIQVDLIARSTLLTTYIFA